MSYPLVSIIVINYNGKNLLEKFLPSVINLDYPNYEVIVVDNASTDGSVEFLKNSYREFKIIQADENYGTAEGSNLGARCAQGEYIFFISNDMELDKNILNYIVQRTENDPKIGICTCKMRRITEEGEKLDIVDSVGGDLDIFGFPISRGINEPDNGQYDCFIDVFFSFGGAMFIRNKVLEEVEGYDSDYFTLSDDIDLSWRVHLAGYRVAVEPKAFLYHRVSATLGITHSRAQKRYLSERNTLRTLLKNYSKGSLILILPLYFLILILEICFFMIVGKPSIAKEEINAVIWNIKHSKGTLRKRRKVQNLRKIKDNDIWKSMLKRSEKIRLFFDFLFNRKAERWANYF